MKDLQAVTLGLMVSSGEHGRVTPEPGLLITVRGFVPGREAIESFLGSRLVGGRWGVVHAVPGAGAWQPVELGQLRALVLALGDLGLPGRKPQLQGVTDTSDVSTSVEVWGALDDAPFAFSLWLMASGYRGADAPAFARLCRLLLGLAGVDLEEHRDLVRSD